MEALRVVQLCLSITQCQLKPSLSVSLPSTTSHVLWMPSFRSVLLAEIWPQEGCEGHSEISLLFFLWGISLNFVHKGWKWFFTAQSVSELHPTAFLPPTPLKGITSPMSSRPTSISRPPPSLALKITCLQMGPLAGQLGAWRAPWWICQLAPAPGLWEVERGRWSRELHDVPRVSF